MGSIPIYSYMKTTQVKNRENPVQQGQVGNVPDDGNTPNFSKCPFRDDEGVIPVCLLKMMGKKGYLRTLQNCKKYGCPRIKIVEGKSIRIRINNFITE